MSQRSSHTHTTAPQGNRTNQSCGKSVPAPRKKNYFLKFPPLTKIFKPATALPTQTAKTLTNSGLTMTEDRRPTGNMGLASCGVKCLNLSVVFQFNFSAGLTVLCPEIPHERQAQKRYVA